MNRYAGSSTTTPATPLALAPVEPPLFDDGTVNAGAITAADAGGFRALLDGADFCVTLAAWYPVAAATEGACAGVESFRAMGWSFVTAPMLSPAWYGGGAGAALVVGFPDLLLNRPFMPPKPSSGDGA